MTAAEPALHGHHGHAAWTSHFRDPGRTLPAPGPASPAGEQEAEQGPPVVWKACLEELLHILVPPPWVPSTHERQRHWTPEGLWLPGHRRMLACDSAAPEQPQGTLLIELSPHPVRCSPD